MAAVLSPPEARILQRGVSWEEFERLVARNANGNLRHAYADGTLDVTVPSLPHEKCVSFFETVITTIADERGIDIMPIGSTTIKRAGLRKGVEPDAAYYVANESAVRDLDEIDFAIHPPDLVIEVDVTNDSMEKLPLFAALGFPEVWRFKDGVVQILILQGGRYVTGPSRAFHGVDAAGLQRLFTASAKSKRIDLIRAIREFSRHAN